MTAPKAPICGYWSPDGNRDGYSCSLPVGHDGDHEAHAWGPGNVAKRWPRSRDGAFEQQVAAELDAADRVEWKALQRGDAAPEDVEERRRQIRAVPAPPAPKHDAAVEDAEDAALIRGLSRHPVFVTDEVERCPSCGGTGYEGDTDEACAVCEGSGLSPDR